MHVSLILIAITLAVGIRLGCHPSHLQARNSWAHRWHRALGSFLVPPLLLIMTSVAILKMGHHGTMIGLPVGRIGCLIGGGFLAVTVGLLGWCFWQGWRSLHQIQSYPLTMIAGNQGRLVQTTALFAAQVGFWHPQLLVSQGLLQTLSTEQVEAILTHEQAHQHYHDTFWFFWLGWLRRCTGWLPNTEALWQELLLLRELRADHWAAQQVDCLTLAEALVRVVRSTATEVHSLGVGFCDLSPTTRFEERIEALMTEPDWGNGADWHGWLKLALALLPGFTILLHQSF